MPPVTKAPGLSAEEWTEILERIAEHLRKPASLCLIGSAPGILSGQPARVSADLDSWQKASKFAHSDLKQACEKAGVMFNPKGELSRDTPYLQIIEEGIVQIGKFEAVTILLEQGKLTVTRPPIENLVASKLVRMEPRDFDDIAYLVRHYGIAKSTVKKVIEGFSPRARERAEENLIYLDVVAEGRSKPAKKPKKPVKKRTKS